MHFALPSKTEIWFAVRHISSVDAHKHTYIYTAGAYQMVAAKIIPSFENYCEDITIRLEFVC